MEKVLLIVRITRPVAQKGLRLTTPSIKRLEELVSYGYVYMFSFYVSVLYPILIPCSCGVPQCFYSPGFGW